jgi:hypothetical protein
MRIRRLPLPLRLIALITLLGSTACSTELRTNAPGPATHSAEVAAFGVTSLERIDSTGRQREGRQ